MNNKGFTLIELLATIILLSIIMTVGAVSVVGAIKTSKEKNYDVLIANVKTAAKSFYEECENSHIIESEIPYKNDGDPCYMIPGSNKLKISYQTLLDYGFLKSSSKKNENKVIENPKDNSSLNECSILVTKEVDSNEGVSYTFSNKGGANCPTDEDYKK